MRGPNPQSRFKNLGLGTMTVPFGGKTEQEEFHPGVDFANKTGTPIPTLADGVVTKVDSGHSQGENNFGNTVEVRDNQGNTQQFHHLDQINVQNGQQVKKGQQVATMGKSGAVYSPTGEDPTNLDFRIVDAYGKYINPMGYLQNF
jgi:murein DD-endopeptidase MepM/ murein hydrolase activator NlpD